MSKKAVERAVQLSVLDRLIDDDPKNSREAPLTRAQSLRELKASIRRDLEWLLNTRRTIEESGSASSLLQESLYNYGMPDVTSLSLDSHKDRDRLQRFVEHTITTFEPRLEGVTVVRKESGEKSRELRFTVEGWLRVEPSPERVYFDTYLELGSGTYRVKGE